MPRVRIGELDLFHTVDGAGEPVLLDNRDAGASDEARGPYGTGDMAADALGVIDHLGIERFHVVGASMGGAIAQHLALLAPTRVATLTLVATWGRTDAFLATILAGWRLMVERLSPEEFLAALAPWAFTYRFLEAPAPEVVAFQAAARERGLLKSVAAYQRQVDACVAHDTLGLLPLLRTPSLVLVGEDDILTPPRYARALGAALPRGEVVLVPASGHACFLATDVTREADIAAMIAAAVESFGKLDILVNNAGAGRFVPFERLEPAEWD